MKELFLFSSLTITIVVAALLFHEIREYFKEVRKQ